MTHMANVKDWIEMISKFSPVAIITAVGGYFVRKFQTDGRKKRMREQLYREISNNYHNLVVRIEMVTSLTGLREAAPMRFNDKLDISFSVWGFYNDDKRKDMLFDLKEAGAISRIYEKFSMIGNEELAGYAHVRGKEAAAEVDDRLADGSLDKKLYKKVSSPDAWKFMDELLTGKRKSYRAYLSPL
jgi:hypothetical protein